LCLCWFLWIPLLLHLFRLLRQTLLVLARVLAPVLQMLLPVRMLRMLFQYPTLIVALIVALIVTLIVARIVTPVALCSRRMLTGVFLSNIVDGHLRVFFS